MKLGGDKLIEEGAKNLKSLKNKIDTTKMKVPSFLMVLIGGRGLCVQEARRSIFSSDWLSERLIELNSKTLATIPFIWYYICS